MTKYRISGDVHGKLDKYFQIVKQADKEGFNTIQLGDLGYLQHYKAVQSFWESNQFENLHLTFKGNHDYYGPDIELDSDLGDYGILDVYETDEDDYKASIFYLSGGFSIDQKFRTPGMDYFTDEELSQSKLDEAIECYAEFKPDYVISHEAPRSIIHNFGNPRILASYGFNPDTFTTRTSEALQTMFEIHQPSGGWIVGHYHRSWQGIINGTHFRCLAELETFDITV